MHPGQLCKANRDSQQNWRHRVLQSREKEYKNEVLQVDTLNKFFCFTQKPTFGFASLVFYPNLVWETAQTTVSRMKRRTEHKTTLYRQPVFFLLLLSICTEVNDWKHKNTQHSIFINNATVDLDDVFNGVDDVNLEEELRSCQDLLVDSELERAGHTVLNYAKDNLKRNCGPKIWSTLQQFQVWSESESSF